MDYSPPITALRCCHTCGRTQDEEVRLQRCVGCFSVLYCSKSCQKSNWKTHKPICRNNASAAANPQVGWNQQLQDLGFSDLTAFTEALVQWLDAHKPALQMCADVAVNKDGGMGSSQSTLKMLLCFLVPRSSTDLPSTRNPSLTFQYKNSLLFNLRDDFIDTSGLRPDWERGAAVRAAMNERYASHPLYAGVLPVIVNVEGFQLAQILYFPHFHPDPTTLTAGPILAAVRRHIVLQDILSLIHGSINEGFPLRPAADSHFSTPALPGRFVRSQGTWQWQQLFSDWSQYRRGQHRGLDKTLVGMKGGFSPPEIMVALKSHAFWHATPRS
ncbi:hypothetical protein K466DRAFT_506076 [Polyporus arcularius HHB13444]|uniref:MYND-type domain-containing protein n=1 Tax=Polyporus arcularius HHB13444 TaxID=1314778 RepID=A0A5C3NPC5_9APHY|nr:hypothetical protein K466DRAFT_506076 [Polyporus arcularius HHB13444]